MPTTIARTRRPLARRSRQALAQLGEARSGLRGPVRPQRDGRDGAGPRRPAPACEAPFSKWRSHAAVTSGSARSLLHRTLMHGFCRAKLRDHGVLARGGHPRVEHFDDDVVDRHRLGDRAPRLGHVPGVPLRLHPVRFLHRRGAPSRGQQGFGERSGAAGVRARALSPKSAARKSPTSEPPRRSASPSPRERGAAGGRPRRGPRALARAAGAPRPRARACG